MVNGVRFRTREVDDRRTTQNSGVHVIAPHGNEDNHDFYGQLCNVWELEYMCLHRVVLFECHWYNTGNVTGRRASVQRDQYCTSIDVRSRWYENDPFVLPSQAKQVFYVNDTKLGEHWRVVVHCQSRGNFDFPEEGDDSSTNNDAYQPFINSMPIEVATEDYDVPRNRDGHASEVIAEDVVMQIADEDTLTADEDIDIVSDDEDVTDNSEDIDIDSDDDDV